MTKNTKGKFHTGTVRKTIRVNTTKEKVWHKISNIVGLPSWVIDVRKTVYLSKRKKGVGSIRELTFEDGSKIEEHVVDWKPGEYFTYVATEGLPLRAYIATLSIKPIKKESVQLTWESYLNSKKMTEKQFIEFLAYMSSFYEASLENLKKILEK